MEKILVSREITLDLSNPDSLRQIEQLKADGFAVYRKEVAEDNRAAKSPPKRPSKADVQSAVSAIRDRHGLSFNGIGALVGLRGGTVAALAKGIAGASPKTWKRIRSLRKRSDSLPPRCPELIAEAAGAARARSLAGPARERRFSDEKRLQIAILRCDERLPYATVAKRAGVSIATVHRVVREFTQKKEA